MLSVTKILLFCKTKKYIQTKKIIALKKKRLHHVDATASIHLVVRRLLDFFAGLAANECIEQDVSSAGYGNPVT